jgi:glycosyltransferase involved in cell wall biosynthesis
VIFLRDCNFEDYQPRNRNFRKVRAEYRWYGWREQLLFPRLLKKNRLDLVHFPHFNVPLLYRRPFVVTIHDLILLRFPSTRATTLGPLLFRLKFLAYRFVIRNAVQTARAIITVSEYSRQDIISKFPAAKTKPVHVTYEASSPRVAAASAPNESSRASKIQGPFALYVGNAYPHKNLESLVNAFKRFRNEGHESYRLVLVGSHDHFYERLERHVHSQGVAEHVTFFGRATDPELAELYERAALYVFPSLFEGFGLPPLEAMGHGLPVASSDATCLPEILGEGALYFNGRDEVDIARAMGEIADDAELRRNLIVSGYEQVKRYDWTTCAEKTLDIYRQSINKDE